MAGEKLTGALDEVILLAAGGAKSGDVGRSAALADVAVGVETIFESDDLDLESFFGEHDDGFFRGIGAGGVGIEVDDDLAGEALEQVDLVLGEGGAAGGKHVLDPGEIDGDAVHLAFNEDDEVVLADGLFGLIQIEEHLPLGIERSLRRVHVLWAGLVSGVEGAGCEGDDAA